MWKKISSIYAAANATYMYKNIRICDGFFIMCPTLFNISKMVTNMYQYTNIIIYKACSLLSVYACMRISVRHIVKIHSKYLNKRKTAVTAPIKLKSIIRRRNNRQEVNWQNQSVISDNQWFSWIIWLGNCHERPIIALSIRDLILYMWL